MLNLHKYFAAMAMAIACIAPASAATYTYTTALSGAAEAPPNASTASGSAVAIYDSVAHTLNIASTFSGLTGSTTAAHIHATTAIAFTGTIGVAVQPPFLAGFPLGVTSGNYTNLVDLTLTTSFSTAFLTANGGTVAGAEAALFQALNDGKAYFNIHTTAFPAGEIRGFLAPAAVPVPASLPLLAAGMALLAVVRRRRQAI